MKAFGRSEREWEDEIEFTRELASLLRDGYIQSKIIQGHRWDVGRLSERRDIVRVEFDEPHPNAPVGNPDLTVYYEGDPLPRLYGRTVSNPFFIECKMTSVVKESVQALRYKWRNGEIDIEKYSGDTTAMTTPKYLRDFSRGDNQKFRHERFLWHLGLGLLRIGEVVAEDESNQTVPVVSFNEEEMIVFDL